MNKKVPRQLFFWLFSVYMVWQSSLSVGSMLCVGANGFVQIEWFSNCCCGPYKNSHPGSSTDESDVHADHEEDANCCGGDCCAECTDLLFGSYATCNSIATDDNLVASSALLWFAPAPVLDQHAFRNQGRRRFKTAEGIPPPLLSLRTVILLS